MSEPLFETPVLGPATTAARARRERREAARLRARRFSVARFLRGLSLGILYVALLGAGMLLLVTSTPLARLAFWLSWPLAFLMVQGVLVLAILWLRRART